MTHQVSLVHITPNAEELISYMARVSNPANQSNTETSQRLIRYLIEHQHWSPFEMVNMCVEINTTRSIAAQILRHRSFSFQEFSQRYSDISNIGSPAIPALRLQDTKNRQNSIEAVGEDKDRINALIDCIDNHFASSVFLYEELLEAGVAKECAREVLPLATPTRLYMNGTIRSWIHYCQLRCGNGTQLEHRMIAEGAYKLLQKHLPSVCAVLAV
jgi:thymidylate synthase (FAD)